MLTLELTSLSPSGTLTAKTMSPSNGVKAGRVDLATPATLGLKEQQKIPAVAILAMRIKAVLSHLLEHSLADQIMAIPAIHEDDN